MRAPTSSARIAACALAAMQLLLACETPLAAPTSGASTPTSQLQRPETTPADDGSTDSTDGTTLITSISLPVDDGSTDGIAVLQWQVFDNPTVIEAFFEKHQPTVIAAEQLKSLTANGIACAQLPLSDVANALRDLGGTYSNIRAWLGEATQWHQLAGLTVRSSIATVVSGTTRRLKEGSLQLLLRGWTVPLESGAVVDLEVACTFVAGGSVPGARSTASELFTSAGFFASIPKGEVLIIAGMPARSSRATTSRGPSSGPPVAAPATLGELLLVAAHNESSQTPRRRVMVIVPLMSGSHFADSAPVESEQSASP